MCVTLNEKLFEQSRCLRADENIILMHLDYKSRNKPISVFCLFLCVCFFRVNVSLIAYAYDSDSSWRLVTNWAVSKKTIVFDNKSC